MLDFSYADAPVPVRPDLPAAHRRAWQRLARAGCWWTGAERVAIAAETRHAPACSRCAERRSALSPVALGGECDHLGSLSDAAVEVVHRVVNDPGRLSRTWFEKALSGGLSDGHYVELIGVVVTVVSIDSFCRGLGVLLRPLPEPEPGDPSRYRPPGARPGTGWVPMVPESLAKGREADLYGMPRTGNVIRALSLVPDAVRQLVDLSTAHYLSPRQMMDLTAGRSLDRAQIELLAARVAALRECFY